MPIPELDQHPFEVVKPPDDLSAAGLRAWVEKTCAYLDVSPTELSRKAGLAPSTLNKFMSDVTDAKSLSSRTLQSLVRAASSIHVEQFSSNFRQFIGPGKVRTAGFRNPTVRVVASLRAEVFTESHLWAIQDQFFVSVPIPNSVAYDGTPIGFVVADAHAEGIFPYGSVIVAIQFNADLNGLELGDFLIVARSDDAGRKELTVRHFIVSPRGDMWLISQAPRAKRAPDIYLGQQGEDGSFLPTETNGYTIEYKVISAIHPYSDTFAELRFPE